MFISEQELLQIRVSYFCSMMHRYAIELAYDGTAFFGWQVQPNAISVQSTIQDCFSKLLSGKAIDLVGCGRTDTGVHASYYVAHLDLESAIDCEQFVYKLNKMLPASIVIFSIQAVSTEFHARFSATNRTYRYFVHQGKAPFLHHSLQLYVPVDFHEMNEAAKHLLGQQDFTSLSKLHTDVKTNICAVTTAKWVQEKEGEWYFEITADRFLRNMVRATVGTLLEVGEGKIQADDIPTILAAKDRSAAKTSVSAHALFLCGVGYPVELFTTKI